MGRTGRGLAGAVTDLTERRGRVVDDNGVPISGAPIVIVASSVPMPEIALVSDAHGAFSLKLPAGRFTLRAQGPRGTSGEIEVEGTPGTGMIVIVVRR